MKNQEPGAARRRGRPRGSIGKRTLFAREWCEKLGLTDPVQFLVTVMNSDTVEVTQSDANGNAVLGADGKPVKQLAVIPLDTRIRCGYELLGYMYPKLQAHQLQAQVQTESAVEIGIDVNALLADPDAARAAQALALKIAAGTKQLPAAPDQNSPHYSS